MVMLLYLVTRRVSFHFKAIRKKQKSRGKNPSYDITEEQRSLGHGPAAEPGAEGRRGGSVRPGGPGRDREPGWGPGWRWGQGWGPGWRWGPGRGRPSAYVRRRRSAMSPAGAAGGGGGGGGAAPPALRPQAQPRRQVRHRRCPRPGCAGLAGDRGCRGFYPAGADELRPVPARSPVTSARGALKSRGTAAGAPLSVRGCGGTFPAGLGRRRPPRVSSEAARCRPQRSRGNSGPGNRGTRERGGAAPGPPGGAGAVTKGGGDGREASGAGLALLVRVSPPAPLSPVPQPRRQHRR